MPLPCGSAGSAPGAHSVIRIDPAEAPGKKIPAEQLRVAGITRFTTIDYPGKLSAVAFLQGCPWKCIYCQNPWMQPHEFDPALEHDSWLTLEKLLMKRRGLLDAVVFSGGEPTADPALPDAVARVKSMGYAAGLHTGGMLPERIRDVLPMLDWVGLDVKAPPEDAQLYDRITGRRHSAKHFLESFRLIQASGVKFECRTTAHPDYLPDDKLIELAKWLRHEGVETFALQIFRRPAGLFSALPPVTGDYPGEAAREALRRAASVFIERRNDR